MNDLFRKIPLKPVFKPIFEGRTSRVRRSPKGDTYLIDSVPEKYNCKSVKEKCKKSY